MFGSRTKTQSQFERVAEKQYTWRSSDKQFEYYDKEAEKRVALPSDAILIPLTSTNSITGVHTVDQNKATERYNQIYSNEFTDYKSEIIKVRETDKLDGTKTVIYEGVYSPTIKEAIAAVPWCKFTKNIYCLLDGEVVKLSLSASSLRPWIDFEDSLRKTHTILTDGHGIKIGKPVQKKNGAVVYFAPSFELCDVSAEDNAKADEIAVIVEEKLAKNKLSAGSDPEAPAQVPVNTETPAEPGAGEEISLDEVPF